MKEWRFDGRHGNGRGGHVNKTIREVALLLVERLRAYLGGDTAALDELRVELLEQGVSEETLNGALAWLRAGAADETEELVPSQSAGEPTARVLSREEQRLVSPDAFGYLLSLAAEGRLDGEQIERIMRRVGQGDWPVSLREVQELVWREATGEPESESDLGNEQTTVH
jgi:uncharacterized protein Smg (DUF494 family)